MIMLINNQIITSIKYLANLIKEQRNIRGLSQTQLADLSDTSINFVAQVEKGKTTVRLDKLLQILKTLGIQLNVNFGSQTIYFPESIKNNNESK
jgi:HTH-type transcriptional regulator / antitoxin HipB